MEKRLQIPIKLLNIFAVIFFKYLVGPRCINIEEINPIKTKRLSLLLGLLILSSYGYAQTITDVQPTRVTTGSTVTVTGMGFYPGLENTMRFDPGGYNITGADSRVFVNENVMTFVIGQTDGTNRSQPLRFRPDPNGPEVLADTVHYIGPITKRHRVGTASDRINPRVQEIYTDFKGGVPYGIGDVFDTDISYTPTEFGKWEFEGLEFAANPRGVMVETGGAGRGMFIGFTDADGGGNRNFIVRGGDGRNVTAPGCGRIEITPATYNFANRVGRLVVTMDPVEGSPTGGEVTLEFDEFSDGTIDYAVSVTATDGFLGYDNGGTEYREWSGGNSGFVGTSLGNIAGSEITSNYDFNGVFDRMLFNNIRENRIAWRSEYGTYTSDPAPPSIGADKWNLPNNNHDLLGFKYDGIIYSTGANDGLLEFFLDDEVNNLPSTEYVAGSFKAYSTNGVQNTTVSQHHIFVGDLLDGSYTEGAFEFLTSSESRFDPIKGLSMFDVLYDGQNGLNIGSGINNLNESTTIQFFSGNGQFGFANDGVPDLLIPNMAEAGGTDVYYFSDEIGNVIGNPLAIEINNNDSQNPPLSHWINDQYRVDLGVSFEIAKPSERIYGNDAQERPMRLIALELDDFGINDLASDDAGYDPFTSVGSIFNVNAGAGGTADVPFLAYNGDTFEIRSPVVTKRPIPRSVCEADGNTNAVFLVEATVDGQEDNPSYVPSPGETLVYEWYKFNNIISDGPDYSGTTTNQLTVNNITSGDLGLYRLKISNDFGATIVTVTIEEGGTRVTWNGDEWVYPPNFRAPNDTSTESAGKTPVFDADRKMVMLADYDFDVETPTNGVLEGCSCEVFAGNRVDVRTNDVLKLYGELNIRQADTIFNPDNVTWDPMNITPAGKVTFENNASLVQMKPVNFNQNTGEILMKRDPIPSDLSSGDYIYWSSPVEDFEIGDITGNLTYVWDTQFDNTLVNGTYGNWVAVNDTDVMTAGKGYIKRYSNETVPVNTAFAEFWGRPHNGRYTIPVYLSGGGVQGITNSNWNLIGNPYPSAISALKFLIANASVTGDPTSDDPQVNPPIEGAVHLWTHQTGVSAANPDPFYPNFGYNYNGNDYLSKNALGQNPAPSGDPFYNIAAGQGFFVKVLNAAPDNPSVIFNNAMRFDEPSATGDPQNDGTDGFDNSQFFRMSENASDDMSVMESQKIWLTLVNENQTASSTLVGYAQGATLEKDNLYDATTNGGSFGIYSLIGDGTMVIQGRPLPFDDTDVVPLGVTINANGIYTIAIDNLAGNIFTEQEQPIFLEDTYSNVKHDLRQSPYSFTAEIGEINDRFLLRYTDETLSTMDNQLSTTFVFINDDVLKVKSNKKINTIEIFDLTGKRVVRHYVMGSMELEEDFNHTSGIYLASILFSDGSVLNKKLIN